MPETPKESEKEKARPVKPTRRGKLSDDQKERSYYYDDACGYEVYQPESEDDGNDLEAGDTV